MMIAINKSTEPIAWAAKKQTPGFTKYEPIPELREALLKDQGYICVYCMQRISFANSKIEHLLSRHEHPDLQLVYTNMYACCNGQTLNETHCDVSKGEKSISFRLAEPFFLSLSYSSNDGTIKSNHPDWDKELSKKTDKNGDWDKQWNLNLNNFVLKANRLQTLEGVIKAISSKSQNWDKSAVKAELQRYLDKDTEGRLKPYCGIVIWYLTKKLRLLEKV